MILEILKYRLVCDVAAGSAEVAPRPEMATPVTFAKFWELHLNAMRRAPFDTSNDVADRDMRWYLDEHMDMLFGQNARDDLYSQFLADLPNDGSYPLAQCSFQNLIAILGNPDDVVAMVKNGVASGCIAHRLFRKMGVCVRRRPFYGSVYDQKTAKASLRLKTKVWNQKRDNQLHGQLIVFHDQNRFLHRKNPLRAADAHAAAFQKGKLQISLR